MNPTAADVPPAGEELLMLNDVQDGVFAALDSAAPPAPAKPAPAAPPAPPPAPAKPAAPPPAPAKPADEDPLSPDFLAKETKKADEGAMPADLLKDEDIAKLPEKKQREAFAKERASHREARLALQERDRLIQELKSKAQDAEQLGELRKQLEARDAEAKRLEAEIAKVDLSRSPGFRKQYDDRMNQLGQRMVQAMVAEGVGADEAAQLARSLVAERKPSVREQAIDEAVPSLKGTLLAFLTQFDEVAQARQGALEKAKETAAAISEAESRARLAAMAGQIDSVTDKAVADAAALGSPYYREVKDNEEWNQAVAERKQALKGLLLSGDPEKLAPYVAEGLTAADMRKRYVALYQRVKDLEAEYAQVVGQRPRLGQIPPSDTPPPPARQPAAGSESMGLEDIVESHLAP